MGCPHRYSSSCIFQRARYSLSWFDNHPNSSRHRSWLDSCKRHFSSDNSGFLEKHDIPETTMKGLRQCVYGRETFDRKHFRRSYRRHVSEVLKYYGNRDGDLLVLDICGGEGWQKICTFLHKPVPNQLFPYENASRKLS